MTPDLARALLAAYRAAQNAANSGPEYDHKRHTASKAVDDAITALQDAGSAADKAREAEAKASERRQRAERRQEEASAAWYAARAAYREAVDAWEQTPAFLTYQATAAALMAATGDSNIYDAEYTLAETIQQATADEATANV
jgi:hypothetical protein